MFPARSRAGRLVRPRQAARRPGSRAAAAKEIERAPQGEEGKTQAGDRPTACLRDGAHWGGWPVACSASGRGRTAESSRLPAVELVHESVESQFQLRRGLVDA